MSIWKSSAAFGGMTMISRVLGFVRDMLLARVFGASAAMDAFFVVFKIPNFLRRLFAEGAFQQAFVPVLSEYRETGTRAELKDYVDHMFGTLAAVLVVVVALGMAGAPLLVLLFAPGFSDDLAQLELAEGMLLITFPYLLFISLTAFAASSLNAFGRFAMPALAPIWLNLSLIAATLVAAPFFEEPVTALAWGVFIAGILQLFFLLPFLARLGLLPRPRIAPHPGVKKTLRLMLPAMFGASVTQINLLVDTILASLLVAGSVSWLYYSDRLVELPLGVFGVAIGTVILPALSRAFARGSDEDYNRTVNGALKLTLLIGVPAMAGLIGLSVPILATLFQYDAFTPSDTAMVSLAMTAYALGLPAFLLIKIFAPGFFARQDTVTPVRIAVISVVANLVFKALLVLPWIVWMGGNLAHVGLALTTVMAAWVNALLLGWTLRRRGAWQVEPGTRRFIGRITLAALAMAGLLLWISPAAEVWTGWAWFERLGAVLGLIALGMAIFVVAAAMLGQTPRRLLAVVAFDRHVSPERQ
ncbi:murein biosynthesis integral membrane protein MurJ [Guyparkeria hydrothermalis]|uniref:murein biosynthesis integral membrane protein MurJ n=1 Tax=Guyparkeria hydrothermalis TaxID=923 RepID=UPI00202242CD|nr:murein biosynthesis integral membrane protein MurJ [Guyparkeria hydrothermalis]MCL7744841.1 murein biosynthesis integral membrane protein MurJ [Guyparkeria hydrothermalis]